MNRVAVFGGTFNPIHIGHLLVAEEIRQLFKFEQVLFVPSSLPPHKPTQETISSQDRLTMTTLATLDNPCFNVSQIEVERGGKSYTVDTLGQLKQIYGAKVDLHFLVGSDAFLAISTWKDIPKLFELCRFVVIERPGAGLDKLIKRFDAGFVEGLTPFEYQLIKRSSLTEEAPAIKTKASVYLIEALSVNISSSEIRALIRRGESIKYLVPTLVDEYILKNRLYQEVRH